MHFAISVALQLLLLFGRGTVLERASLESLSKDKQFSRICDCRNSLCRQMYEFSVEDMFGSGVPFQLHRRWRSAPPQLLKALVLQVMLK